MLIQKQYNNFPGNVGQAGNTALLFILEEVKGTILNFLQGTMRVLKIYFDLIWYQYKNDTVQYIFRTNPPTHPTPSPLHERVPPFMKGVGGRGGGGCSTFSKLLEMRGVGVWKSLLEKGGGVCLEIWELSYYTEVFLKVPHDAPSRCVYLSFVNKHVLQIYK